MKNLLFVLCVLLAGCGNSDRQEKDITNEEEQNISPNQVISKEEQMKKDSTSSDILEKDTANHQGH